MSSETKSLDLENPADWLRAKGEERQLALRKAADRLLEVYRLSPRIPGRAINLYKLAALVHAKIVLIKSPAWDGRLLPVHGGFQVLISTGLPSLKFRASVAHELAHSLFFSRNGDEVPVRLIPRSQEEHHFCLDLARHILAPVWLLKEVGVFNAPTANFVFHTLTARLGMSRPFAARLMLADYELRTGVADRWILKDSAWQLKHGNSYVSSSITGSLKSEKKIREWLRSSALRVLHGEPPDPSVEVTCLREKDNRAAFVLVTKRPHL